jgi:tetratricopeptide (TPR) repeat protein
MAENQKIPNSAPNLKPSPAKTASKPRGRNRSAFLRFLLWLVLFCGLVFIAVLFGGLIGFRTTIQSQHATETVSLKTSLNQQFDLAIQDISENRYEVARQRLEYVIAQDPSYPGVTDKMAQVMSILYATATPTLPSPTGTATPTRDLRPVEDMYKQAGSLVAAQKWTEAIDTLVNLRKTDPAYQTARVDGMLFISLRQLGVDKIWKDGDLEGGIYDLALAARFAPLDVQANSSRELARLYVIGSSFWEVLPDQAIIYFSQVAAAAPGLRDMSGWTASARYREVLIQYGDQLAAKKDWCTAQQQYELALSMGADATLQGKASNAALQCSPPTGTPTNTSEIPTATLAPNVSPSPTATTGVLPTFTNTPPAPTDTVAGQTDTPQPPTETPQPPTETPVPPTATEVIIPTDTSPAPEVTTPPP